LGALRAVGEPPGVSWRSLGAILAPGKGEKVDESVFSIQGAKDAMKRLREQERRLLSALTATRNAIESGDRLLVQLEADEWLGIPKWRRPDVSIADVGRK